MKELTDREVRVAILEAELSSSMTMEELKLQELKRNIRLDVLEEVKEREDAIQGEDGTRPLGGTLREDGQAGHEPRGAVHRQNTQRDVDAHDGDVVVEGGSGEEVLRCSSPAGQ